MRPGAGGWQNATTPDEQDALHGATLDVLRDVGLQVQSAPLLEALAGIGAEIDAGAWRARFPRHVVETFLDRCSRIDWNTRQPRLTVRAGCYCGRWLDPETGSLEPITEQRLAGYWRAARALPGVTAGPLYGAPWGEPPALEPLLARVHAWRHGVEPAAVLYPYTSSQAILDLCATYAGLRGVDVREVCRCAVFLISPLRLAAEEAAQVEFWWRRGFRVEFGHMPTGIASAPATIAGLMALSMAESLGIALLKAALYGTHEWSIVVSAAAADPRSMARPYGRPEMALANLIGADMARYYGVPVSCHSGLTDAKSPSTEAGCQKTLSTLASLMAGADAMIDAGVLAIDEVISPVQLVLDAELGQAILRLMRGAEITAETLALEVIRERAPGGMFVDHEHTVRHFRREHWLPEVWSRDTLGLWEATGRPTADDRARAMWERLRDTAPAPSGALTADDERALGAVVDQARRTLCG